MMPYYQDDTVAVYHGDCLGVLPGLSGITAVVTDPPYGLSFMGKEWDHGVPGRHFWQVIQAACLPGASLLAFGGTRTHHRLVCAIEDAGWEVRDCLQYLYGSGFPKSHDVSKAIDKAAGAEREVVGPGRWNSVKGSNDAQADCLIRPGGKHDETAPATPLAALWHGYGTALKPAHEMICLAMNPLDGTFANNAIQHGVAGLNVDGGRVGTEERTHIERRNDKTLDGEVYGSGINGSRSLGTFHQGRWPANIIHDGSDEVLAGFPVTKSGNLAPYRNKSTAEHSQVHIKQRHASRAGDSGSAARFFKCCPQDEVRRYFYAAKSSKRERNLGLDSTRTVKYDVGNIGEASCKDVSTVLAESLRRATSGSIVTWHTGESGASIMGRCPSDSVSTIETETSKITESKILNLLTPQLTSECMAVANYGAGCGGSPASCAEKVNQSTSSTGISAERVGRCMAAAKSVTSELCATIRNAENWQQGRNTHSTVKPLALMRYLCTLVTMPERNLILDPFAGSGTTGVACKELGLPCILIEQDEHNCEIIAARVAATQPDPPAEPDPQQELPL